MPTGYSFNLDGSTLYLSLASIFVAQAAGIHMSLGQQLLLMLTLMLTSKGVAGVSRARRHSPWDGRFVRPAHRAGIHSARDRPVDGHGAYGGNVLGNCLATVVIARWEGTSIRRRTTLRPTTPVPDNRRGSTTETFMTRTGAHKLDCVPLCKVTLRPQKP